MLRNFGESISSLLPTVPEVQAHPHAPEERAHLFTALSGGAVEIEALTFLNALVYLYKPRLALETGTGSGYSAAAIAAAMRANGFGTVHTVELDEGISAQAEANVRALDEDLLRHVRFGTGESLRFIDGWRGEPFDFAFFDSLVAFRHVELERLVERGLLADGAVCAFHDTSRRRGERMGDFNPEMIAALDRRAAEGDRLESHLSRGLRVIRLPARAPVRGGSPDVSKRTFRHSGTAEEVLYALPAIRALGGGELLLDLDGLGGMTLEEADRLLPLLRLQAFLSRCDVRKGEPVEVDFDAFREQNPAGSNLADRHLDALGLRRGERDVAWLRVNGPAYGAMPRVLFARGVDQQGVQGFWEECYRLLGQIAAFVGSEEEHRAFCRQVGDVPHVAEADYLDMARVIAAAEIFVCGQGYPMAIAEGLKRPMLVDGGSSTDQRPFTRASSLILRSPDDLASIGAFVAAWATG